MEPRKFFYKTMESPVGPLRLVASEKGLYAVLFHGGRGSKMDMRAMEQDNDRSVLRKTETQLAEYFAGKRKVFELPLDAQGSVFQIKAWKELQKIPYGQTISYGEKERRMGDTKKARAAGMANGRNPLSIVVPCHRVVGSNGALTGFGGGLKTKQFLLEHEHKFAA